MKLAAFIGILTSVVLWLWQFKVRKEIGAALIGAVVLIWLIASGYLGLMMRPLPLLFVIHYVFIFVAWIAWVWYLLKGRLLWWFWLLPALTLALYLLLALLEGSRFEA